MDEMKKRKFEKNETYFDSVKFWTATTASSSLLITKGILFTPGDFNSV
jgi:hypothetical protein